MTGLFPVVPKPLAPWTRKTALFIFANRLARAIFFDFWRPAVAVTGAVTAP